ncbi:MAG: hypothetical protein V2A62_01955 [Candidatus Woesearchaeota archaeon]
MTSIKEYLIAAKDLAVISAKYHVDLLAEKVNKYWDLGLTIGVTYALKDHNPAHPLNNILNGAFVFGVLFSAVKRGPLNQYARNTLVGLATGALAYNSTIFDASPEILGRNYAAAAVTGIGALYFELQMRHTAFKSKDSSQDITDRLTG